MRMVLARALLLSASLLIQGSAEQGSPSSSWGNLQISPKAIGFVPYRDYHIAVYESLDAERPDAERAKTQYFCAPIVLLEPSTVEYQFITIKKTHVVRFNVAMWSAKVEGIVTEYMNDELKVPVGRAQVRPMPFEEMLLTCKPPAGTCRCPAEWQSYQLHNAKTFKLTCPTEREAKRVAGALKDKAKEFESFFVIKFRLAARNSQVKETSVKVEHVVYGDVFSRLDQRFPEESEVLLTADDKNRLVAESTGNVIVKTFSENEVISDEGTERIYKLLENMIVKGDQWVNSQSGEKLWDSVFWNEDNYRPDRLASGLNEVYGKSDAANREKLRDVVSNADRHSIDSRVLASLDSSIQESSGFTFVAQDSSRGGEESERRRENSHEEASAHEESESEDRSAAYGGNVGGSWLGGMNVGGSYSPKDETSSSVKDERSSRAHSSEANGERRSWHEAGRESIDSSGSTARSDDVKYTMREKIDRDDSVSEEREREEQNNALRESLAKVQWTGERFVPRAMKLTRINLSKLRNSQTYRDKRVAVSFTLATLVLDVNINLDDQEVGGETPFRDLDARLETHGTQHARDGPKECEGLEREVALCRSANDDATAALMKLARDVEQVKQDSLQLASDADEKIKALGEMTATQVLLALDQQRELNKMARSVNEKVHFFARNYKPFGPIEIGEGTTVKYDELVVNVRGGMNAKTGVFTAPRDGHYAFQFHATCARSTAVSLELNGRHQIASSFVQMEKSEDDVVYSVVSLSAVVQLEEGDTISVHLHHGKTKGSVTVEMNGEQSEVDYPTTFGGFSVD